MAFDLFQAPPVEESSNSERPASLDMFSRPPSLRAPKTEEPAEEPASLDMFSRPPGQAAPRIPAPAEQAPTPAPRAPADSGVEFTREERAAFNQFAAPPKTFPNPDTDKDVLFKSLPDGEQGHVRKDWLQRFRQSQQPQPEQPRQETREAPQPPAQEKPKKPKTKEPGVPEGFESVESLDQFRPGDEFYEDGFRGKEILKVREVQDDALVAKGGMRYYLDEIERHPDGGFLRKPGPHVEESQADEGPDDRPYGEIRDPKDVREGDILKYTGRYNNRYAVVRKIGDKLVATEYVYGGFEAPLEVTEELLRDNRAERIKREDAIGRFRTMLDYSISPIKDERVRKPIQMRRGGLMRVGEGGDDTKRFYVHKMQDGDLKVQQFDHDSGRVFGRPKRITAQGLKDHEYFFVQSDLPEKRNPPGDRIKRITSNIREGKIFKLYFDKTPSWARVVSVETGDFGDGVFTVQRVNSRTGRDIGDPEKITQEDLESWAHIRKIPTIPKKLRPPPKPLVAPDGGEPQFADKGEGELVPNFQPHRYEDVNFRAGERTRENLRRLLGDKIGDRDPVEVVADLVGAGGITRLLSTISISIGSSEDIIEVHAEGPGISSMSRRIEFEEGEPSTIYNLSFEVKGSRRRGGGVGTRMLATQVAAAKEAGFEEIKVHAAGGPSQNYRGYYAWPALGYTAAVGPYTWSRIPRELKDAVLEVYPRDPEQSERTMPIDLEFVHLMAAGKDVRKWWKENGSGMHMRFPLGDDSLSVQALTKYVREKAEETDVGADEFLQRSASRNLFVLMLAADETADETSDSDDKIEEAPLLDDADEKILDKIWAEMREEMTHGR